MAKNITNCNRFVLLHYSFYDTNSVISTKNRIFGRCGDKKPITMCFVARDPISLTIEVGLSVTSPPLLCFATLTIQIGDDLPFGRVVNGTRSECLSSFTLRWITLLFNTVITCKTPFGFDNRFCHVKMLTRSPENTDLTVRNFNGITLKLGFVSGKRETRSSPLLLNWIHNEKANFNGEGDTGGKETDSICYLKHIMV